MRCWRPGARGARPQISHGLRCVVCQNESIDESNADLAHDLRVLVRERLVAGDSDDQVIQYVVDRYGDFVLLRPPVKPETYLLWASPAILLLIAAVLIAIYLRRHRRIGATPPPLTAEEQARVDALLKADAEPYDSGSCSWPSRPAFRGTVVPLFLSIALAVARAARASHL
jgi:cytochrome c-type biogenesis protein CcmH/NrfF